MSKTKGVTESVFGLFEALQENGQEGVASLALALTIPRTWDDSLGQKICGVLEINLRDYFEFKGTLWCVPSTKGTFTYADDAREVLLERARQNSSLFTSVTGVVLTEIKSFLSKNGLESLEARKALLNLIDLCWVMEDINELRHALTLVNKIQDPAYKESMLRAFLKLRWFE